MAKVKAIGLTTVLCIGGQLAVAQTGGARGVSISETQRRIEQVTGCLPLPVSVKGEGGAACRTLAQRMTDLHVPGVSIAVVHHGAIEWARGFGVKAVGGEAVTAETLFQAGSISKPLAAMATLHQVELGKLSLDGDVNKVLTSWKIPESAAAPGAVVTLRELLTHTAGFTVHGFPGYAADAPVPSLTQVLDGEKPANTGPIRLEDVPGKKYSYSGGGYTVMQQAVIDATKVSFPKVLHDTVLEPIGMTHSTYEQPLPTGMRAAAAIPYARDGKPITGGAHTYPEMAAAGLWTTPSDLALYILENQASLQGKANHVLSQAMTAEMMKPGIAKRGLGLEMGGSASAPYFSHGGVNEGFESLFVGYENGGDGAVVMTNAAGGLRLAEELMRSIAVAYDWPDFKPSVRVEVKVAPAVLERYVGTYFYSPQFSVVYTVQGGQLMTQATGQKAYPLFPESETKFFLKVVDAENEFFMDAEGKVAYVVLHQNGQDLKLVRK